MKTIFVFLLCSLSAFSQSYVECYYSKEANNPILIFDQINGKVVDTLYNVDDKSSWYTLAIAESEYGWFKIRDLRRLPSSSKTYSYENYWVKNINFLVNVDNYDETHHVYLYDLPSTNANKIHKLDDFQKVSVTEVSGNWSKVKFKVGKKEIEGWLSYRDQCGYPWTTCPKYD